MEGYDEGLARAFNALQRNPINIPEAYKLSSCLNYPQWKKFFDYYVRRVGNGLPEYICHTLDFPSDIAYGDKTYFEHKYNTLINEILEATVESGLFEFVAENEDVFGLDMYETLELQFAGTSRRSHFHGVIDSMRQLLSGDLTAEGAVDAIRCLKNNDAFDMSATEMLSYLLLYNLDDNSASRVLDDFEVPLDFDQISDKYVGRPDPYAAVKAINKPELSIKSRFTEEESQKRREANIAKFIAAGMMEAPETPEPADGDDNTDNSNETGDDDLPMEASSSALTASATDKKKKKKNKNKNKKKKKKKCARCQDLGHIEDECIYPYKIPENVHMITTECYSVIEGGLKMDYHNYWFSATTPAHICNNRKHFEFFVDGYSGPEVHAYGDTTPIKVEGVGNVVFVLDSKTIVLRDVLYVPTCPANMVSARLCSTNGTNISFEDEYVIESRTGMAIASGLGVKGYKFLPVLKLPEELSVSYIID